uniref:Response regulator receiver n=1 Tax=Magnetospirillum gryphiswaldense TaxID=55518 RepID=A4U4Q8_9PROT|nr:response regulator receiver [Magnetospirillum gryphiswaldense MSR-1]
MTEHVFALPECWRSWTLGLRQGHASSIDFPWTFSGRVKERAVAVNKTVLLVDDSRVARMMTRKMIETDRPGWQVVEAATGEEALEVYSRVLPDFVIMDVNMPGMGGLEATKRLKAVYPQAVVTLLTANIQDPVREQAEEMGVGFMSKPVRGDVLMAFLSVDEE